MRRYWSNSNNRKKQSKRQAICIANGMTARTKYARGFYENPTKSAKQPVYFRSLFEYSSISHFEKDNDILSYKMEPFIIEYDYDNCKKHYVPDVLIETRDKKILIEIKPSCYTHFPINLAKFDAAKKFSDSINAEFCIWTEKTHAFLQQKKLVYKFRLPLYNCKRKIHVK